MSAVLADLRTGFRDPVHGAQQAFRTLLRAMALPGRVLPLPDRALDGLAEATAAFDAFGVAAIATLLALLDAETTVHLHGHCDRDAVRTYLRFHAGARIVETVADAAFVMARAGDVDAALRSCLAVGTDEAPQDGATLVVEVDALGNDGAVRGTSLTLSGPGLERPTRFVVAGLPDDFWAWRVDLQRAAPRGVDLVLACDDRIGCLPRSTRVIVEEPSCT